MSVVVLVANKKGMSEVELMNAYTMRQLTFLYYEIVREKFMLVNAVFKSAGKGKSKVDMSKTPGVSIADKLRRQGKKVVDLDGPLSELAPYVGGIGAKPHSTEAAPFFRVQQSRK